MASIKTGRVFRFGPDDCLVGSFTAPTQASSRTGVILWGMGLAEMQAARLLARQGFPCLQTRLHKQDDVSWDDLRQIYDVVGINRFKDAMSVLGAQYNVERFILMGNCAHANMSFNTALEDSRVAGLILTNPHFSGVQTFGLSFGRKALRPRSWRKLLSGEIKLSWLRATLLRKLGLADEQTVISQWEYKRDLVLPADFGGKLEGLAERGVACLIVYAFHERSLQYLRAAYGKAIAALEASGSVTLKVIDRDSHIFSKDHVAVEMLNDIIGQWSARFSAGRGLNEEARGRASAAPGLPAQQPAC
jgi:hypothetical protein